MTCTSDNFIHQRSMKIRCLNSILPFRVPGNMTYLAKHLTTHGASVGVLNSIASNFAATFTGSISVGRSLSIYTAKCKQLFHINIMFEKLDEIFAFRLQTIRLIGAMGRIVTAENKRLRNLFSCLPTFLHLPSSAALS